VKHQELVEENRKLQAKTKQHDVALANREELAKSDREKYGAVIAKLEAQLQSRDATITVLREQLAQARSDPS